MASSSEEDKTDDVVKKQIGYQYELVSPHLLRVHIPTMAYEAFNPAGHVKLWSLLKLVDPNRLDKIYWNYGDLRVYLLGMDMTIDASFYNIHSPKSPLMLDYRKLFVNKSSKSSSLTVHHKSMSKPYVVIKCFNVNVDPRTRTPTPFPRWWLEKHQFPTSHEKQIFTMADVPEDGKYMTNHRSVHFSDIDRYGHMNFTVYVRFCYETLFENLLGDTHCYGADDMFMGNTREFHVNFKQECMLGDLLAIKSWRDHVSSDTYHFDMLKKNDSVASMTMAFYKCDMHLTKHSKL